MVILIKNDGQIGGRKCLILVGQEFVQQKMKLFIVYGQTVQHYKYTGQKIVIVSY